MTISFHNVVPAPLPPDNETGTDIWRKECFFKEGSKYSIVAPSGKGKTTFIHLIYGLRYDYTGQVWMGDHDVKSITANQWTGLRRDEVSIVYQDLRLFLQMTALENLQIKSSLYRNISSERIKGMAEQLGVVHVLSKPCHTLSYGERQRVAIIRSLLQPFKYILLDEPFSHLDAANASKAASLIDAAVGERNAGLIITSLREDQFFAYDSTLQL